jgi:hypothetical protein
MNENNFLIDLFYIIFSFGIILHLKNTIENKEFANILIIFLSSLSIIAVYLLIIQL